tara:strand:- start:1709 stop:2389 length:681 start_codon:yes stop_codon:yes gene_type:complete
MNKIIAKVEKLKKVFDINNKKIEIFNNVNISFKAGELVALIGPSGSGKSTFLHLVALLDSPSLGRIIFKGNDTRNYDEKEKDLLRRKNISLIFQNNNLLSDFNALENVMMPLLIRGENYKNSRESSKKILKQFNLQGRFNHYPNELSGGEQQRVAIARTLIAKTDLILADEPTGNLDEKTSLNIFSYFQKLKKLNKSIIFATHNRELANKADYKLIISKGNIIKKS